MAKTILLKLTSEIIADFESSFSKPEEKRSYLYQHATKKINDGIADVFIKKTLNLRLIKDSKPIVKQTTLAEINFDKVELVSNLEWESKDIAGSLESFEYVLGDAFWDKILQWAKLSSILNRKFNDSVLENNEQLLSNLKLDVQSNPNEIKQKESQVSKSKEDIETFRKEECIESYMHSLFFEIIITKIKSEEQQRLDKEFAELNKPKTPPTVN